jgi:hypothetical protein
MTPGHSFHIPVMGIGFTIDSPVRVAHLGISSAISIVDDIIIERMREFYCAKFNLPYTAISENSFDSRCERIKAYLNTVDEIVKHKIEDLKKSFSEKSCEMEKYFDMLPDMSVLKQNFLKVREHYQHDVKQRWEWMKENFMPGSIDVNIMTKIDKVNYHNGEKLPVQYNDAHAALRGFAESNLRSSVVLSAGMNPQLYSYIEHFDDFYPSALGELRKKIILKVSDYRSALIQGKFLAKKGIWVSEFRIESGLNCGGHAFATDGYLMGPVLEEFKVHRKELQQTMHDILVGALTAKQREVPAEPMELKITAQGGVGTAQEHQFLMEHYELDSVGWGTPFLLVPEAAAVDEQTMQLLCNAKEDDLYLSPISPLGVPFNNVRGNTRDLEKYELAAKGKPGSACTKKLLKIYAELDGKIVCTASKEYQRAKIAELEERHLAEKEFDTERMKIIEKACLCKGLVSSTLLSLGLDTSKEGSGVSVCPGPNMAYFDKVVSLREMVGHIYGRNNVISRTDRPHMFVNELKMYVDHLKNKVAESVRPISTKQTAQLNSFRESLNNGIDYYKAVFSDMKEHYETRKDKVLQDLEYYRQELSGIKILAD